jgi:hypothetical protein
MDWLPKDVPSFIWGVVVAGTVAAIAKGFLKKRAKTHTRRRKKSSFLRHQNQSMSQSLSRRRTRQEHAHG